MSKSLPAAGRQMPNECQMAQCQKLFSFVKFYYFGFGFGLKFELLTFDITFQEEINGYSITVR
jgi:hypothetical protein